MNNLTTRKIVLGMLMALVLVFSVQGIADAQTTIRRGSGDLQLKEVGDTFTISFSVSDVTFANNVPNGIVSINLNAASGVTLTKINNVDAAGRTSLTGATAPNALSNRSYTLTFSADAIGQQDIVIGGTVTFTVYVASDEITSDTLSLAGTASTGFDFITNAKQIDTHFNGATNQQIRYVVSGGGSVYVREAADRTGGSTSNLLTSSDAIVWLRSSNRTSTVTVSIEGQNPDLAQSATYIYRYARITKVSGDIQTGITESRLENPLIVEVRDGSNGIIRGVTVTFAALNSGSFLKDPSFPLDLYGDDPLTTVKTNSSGRANIFLVLGANEEQDQGATASVFTGNTGSSVAFSATAGDPSAPAAISIVSGDGQRVANGLVEDPLVVKVVNRQGQRLVHTTDNEAIVEFLARDGGTLDPNSNNNPILQRVETDAAGEAKVNYIPPDDPGRRTVSATIVGTGKSVTFTINGTPGSGGGGGGGGDDDDDADPDVITFSDTTIEGEPGDEVDITVRSSPSNAIVELSSPDFENSNFSPQFGRTPFVTTLTLPDETGSHDIFATRSGFTPAAGTVTVGAGALGTLTISPTGTAVNGVQTVSITARTAAGTIPSGSLTVALSGTGFTTTSAIVLNGTVNAGITLPTTAATYTLTVSATGYNSASTLLTVGTTTGTTTTTTTRGPAGEADSVEIDGSRQLSGTVDQAMRLRVRVLDANDNGVSDVRVTFRVLAPGRGTFAGARGNGRAVADQTDRNGYASANLTPSDDGDIIVRASAAGVSADVTFIIDVGEAVDDPEPPTPSRDVTPSRDISPVVHVGAASRPPMLWIDGGAIYGLVGADAQKFAPSVDNALNITVAGGKVYWTEMTGESSGTINSANLNGSGVTELTSIMAVPMGIAVDVAGSKLYWTNSRGRIQSANLDGSRITNELQDLPSPMDLALGNGNVYWTQGNGSVRVVNLTGQKIVRDISTGSDTPGSLVIGGGKVYWTEKTGDSSGTVNSANLNGTGATQLASIRAVPMGIAVDTVRSKLFWTNSRGRVQSADLDGSGITNVVSGLGSPGDMVLSNSIAAPTAATTTPTTPTTTASRSKYDLNGDGTVDNTDAGLVADAMGTSNARYDVNGDGTVNFLDLLLVFDNRDAGAAGAPTIVGMKMSAAQIDIIEEQIDLLIATNDRSPAAMRVLVYLQQLLVTARPEKTQLLANYPNPFNPETWIPYELATDTDVRLTIYNTQGVVIRTLQFGHQSAGYYVGRDRAAYWDGRNALGEQVSSGLYFYQLETDEMSSMRKMVILK